MNGRRAKRIGIGAGARPARRKAAREGTRLAQQPKPLPQRSRRRAGSRPPTWPRTSNQRLQSRPLIYEHPTRHLEKWARDEYVHASDTPKHVIDLAAQSQA